MPWFVRNLLQASSPLRLYGWRGVRGVGRARKKDAEASELWSQMGEDELLNNAPQFSRLQRQDGVTTVNVNKDLNTHEQQSIPVIKKEQVKNKSMKGKPRWKEKNNSSKQLVNN